MIARFEATRVGSESLSVRGDTVECVRVKVALPGLMSIFFSMDLWYRKSDGIALRFQAPEGPGKPPVVTDLTLFDARED